MKIVSSFILGLAFYSSLYLYGCKDAYKETPVKTDTVYIVTKSVLVQPTVTDKRYDSLLTEHSKCVKTKDSLKTKLFLANYKIEKVKYYVAIVNRKPSQIKYLKGWVRRAVE